MDLDKIPEDVLMELRTLKRANAGKDLGSGEVHAQIKAMSPEDAFDALCNWNGLIDWGPTLRGWMTVLSENP